MVQEAVEQKLETAVVEEGNPAQSETEAATPSAPEVAVEQPDYQKLNAQLSEELARERSERQKETQARRSAEGRLNANDRKRIITAERMVARTLSDEDRAEAMREAEVAAKQDEDALRVDAEVSTGYELLNDYAQDMGKSFAADPAFAEIRTLYSNGNYFSAAKKMRDLHKADDAVKREAEVQAREATRLRNREALQTATPRPAAASVSVNPDNIDALYMQGKVPEADYRRFLREHGI